MTEAAMIENNNMIRTSIITGGGGGIGIAIARRFLSDNEHVILIDRSPNILDMAVDKLKNLGGKIDTFVADLRSSESCNRIVEQSMECAGRIDTLINSAGAMGKLGPICKLSDQNWHDALDTNLSSVFYMCRAVIPKMVKQKSGAIVNLSSIAGKEGTPELVPYSTAKAGIIALTKALGKEVVGDGVRVNCVAPGIIETPLLNQLPPESTQAMLSKSPMQRFGTADEVAAVVQFLASDEASFVTSQCYDVSGGRATY